MDIDKMDIKDLKALAYDVAGTMQKLQQDLMTINQEIINKNQRQVKEIKDDVKIDIKE